MGNSDHISCSSPVGSFVEPARPAVSLFGLLLLSFLLVLGIH
jgi:hypothetical protein